MLTHVPVALQVALSRRAKELFGACPELRTCVEGAEAPTYTKAVQVLEGMHLLRKGRGLYTSYSVRRQ